MSSIKNLVLIVFLALGLINRFLPKLNIIIFFTNNKESNDNNRALLRRLIEKEIDQHYKIYFFSRDAKKYQHYSQVNYKSVFFAPFYFLLAKYCFYDCGTLKIKPSRKQYVISLWHGVPLKKIGLMIDEQSSKLDRYNDFTKILVPSESWKDVYKASFACSEEQIFINGFPRNDYLFSPAFNKLGDLGVKVNFTKSILWMPTFRSSIGGRYHDAKQQKKWDLPLFDNLEDLSEFNKYLCEKNTQLIIKLHPYSTLNLETPENLTHIVFIKNINLNRLNIINYEFVACFDALITDYSSILFDYLLVNKPIGFTVDDIKSYEEGRGFTVLNPAKYLVGPKIKNENDLAEFINSVVDDNDSYTEQRKIITHEVHKYADDQASNRLLETIGLL